jgi:hypothetical protein
VAGGRRTDVLEENLENTTGLLIDKTRNTLHTTSTSKTPDRGLCDTCGTVSAPEGRSQVESHTLDVIAQNFAMALSSTLSESLGACERRTNEINCK